MPRYELWGGADATTNAWSIYGGATFAPFGDIRSDGARFRSATGYGAYRYVSLRWDDSARARNPVSFTGRHTFGDLLAGYQVTMGPWTVKVFAGATQETHDLRPFDSENQVSGGKAGFKAALETWLALGDRAFMQSDLSWSGPFEVRGGRIRAGWRLDPSWSAGFEAAYNGTASHDSGRLGTFARFEWTGGEISASAGAADDRRGETDAYGSLALLIRF